MRFLSGTEIQREVSDLVNRDGDTSIAVAYWGHDAVDRTGIAQKKNGNLRILCDLLSGFCNPFPIEVLRMGEIPVRTLNLLHAKVWINGSNVILGSANASVYGLLSTAERLCANAAASFWGWRRRASLETVRVHSDRLSTLL